MTRTQPPVDLRWKLWLHPHAPAHVGPGPPHRVRHAYRAGLDPNLWRAVAPVRVDAVTRRLAPGQKLHTHGIIAEPKRQFCGLGGPYLFYASFSRPCRSCGARFVFSATAQKRWYEEVQAYVGAVAEHCSTCRRARWQRNHTGPRWARARAAWQQTPTVAAAHELAEAGLALVDAGRGQGKHLERMVSLLRAAIRQHPTQAELRGWLAVVEGLRGRPEAARALAETFLQQTRHRRTKRLHGLRERVAAVVP